MLLIYKEDLRKRLFKVFAEMAHVPANSVYQMMMRNVESALDEAQIVESFCGVSIEEAMTIIDHYKRTGEQLTEHYVRGYAAGFEECDKQYKHVFANLNCSFDGAKAVEFKKFNPNGEEVLDEDG